MEKVIEISRIIEIRKKYEKEINRIKQYVFKSQKLYEKEIAADIEEILDCNELFEYFRTIISSIYDNLTKEETDCFNLTVEDIINRYEDDTIYLGFILLTFVSLVKITDKLILTYSIEEQITMCELIDSLGENAYKDPKYINLYLNETIRKKLKEVAQRKGYKMIHLFIGLVDDLECDNINFSILNIKVINTCLDNLNDYLKPRKPVLLENSYEDFLGQYITFSALTDDRHDYLLKKIDTIMLGNDEALKKQINLISAGEDTIMEKIEKLNELVFPPEEKIIKVDFVIRQRIR